MGALSYVFVVRHASASRKDVMEVASFFILYKRDVKDLKICYDGRKMFQDSDS